jgi:uncharacterized protein YggE
MKLSATLAMGATIAAAAMFAACGGGSDAANDNGSSSSSKITTQHGLAVAALYGNGQSNVAGDLSAAAPAAEGAGSDSTSSNSASARSASNGPAAGADIAAPQAAGDGAQGITVSGFGLATADPDTAIISLFFSRYSFCCDGSPVPEPLPPIDANGNTGSSGITPGDNRPQFTPGPVEPITEADLQPVINALVAAGVARGDIEFTGQTYYDQYNASATLTATVKNIDNLQSALDAAQTAASGIQNTSMSTSVSYTLGDCSAIEKAALDAAVTDAGERGQQLADALHVSKGKVIGASDFSWSPSGSQCSSSGMPYPIYFDKARDASGAAVGSNSVQVVAQISVTYELN